MGVMSEISCNWDLLIQDMCEGVKYANLLKNNQNSLLYNIHPPLGGVAAPGAGGSKPELQLGREVIFFCER